MAELHAPSDKEIIGPWYVDHDALSSLDGIIDQISNRLKSSYEVFLRKLYEGDDDKEILIERKIQEKKHISVQLDCRGGQILRDNTVAGLLKDTKLENLSCESLDIQVRYDYSDSVSFTINSYPNRVRYKIKTSDIAAPEDIRFTLEGWVRTHKPHPVITWWSEYGTFFLITCLGVAFMGFVLSFQTETTVNLEMKKEIEQMLKNGVTTQNQAKATELILRNQLGQYWIKSARPELEGFTSYFSEYWLEISSIMAVLALSFFRPYTIIGVGRNKKSMEFYKWYSKFFAIVLPLFIIAVVGKKLVDWFLE